MPWHGLPGVLEQEAAFGGGHRGGRLVGQPCLAHGVQICLGGKDEARRHGKTGADQFAEIGGFATGHRRIDGAQIRQPDHCIADSRHVDYLRFVPIPDGSLLRMPTALDIVARLGELVSQIGPGMPGQPPHPAIAVAGTHPVTQRLRLRHRRVCFAEHRFGHLHRQQNLLAFVTGSTLSDLAGAGEDRMSEK